MTNYIHDFLNDIISVFKNTLFVYFFLFKVINYIYIYVYIQCLLFNAGVITI